MRTGILVWSFLLVCPVNLLAQERVEDDTLAVASDDSGAKNGGVLLLAGAGGMLVGGLGGGLVGVAIDEDSGLDDAEGAIIGGVMGTSLAIPVAVHLANRRRGNLGRSMLVSALVGGTLLGVGWAAESGEIVLAAPFAQLITSVIIERSTTRSTGDPSAPMGR
jgi:hypothetical protein